MKPTATFWNLIAKKYIASDVADQAIYERKLAQTQALLKPDWHVLEIGCGSGNTALTHAPFVAQITGIDFAQKMIDHARAQAAERGIDNAVFETKSMDEISVEHPYDAVLMLSVLHLLPQWKQAIRTVYDLTAEGGAFVSSTACLKDMAPLIAKCAPLFSALPVLPSIAGFSQSELLQELRAAGFEIEDYWQVNPKDATFVVARKPSSKAQ